MLKETYRSIVAILATLSIFVIVFIVLGVVFSLLMAFLYVNNPAYCRDCNTGLGLLGIGFCASGLFSPLILWGIDRILSYEDKPQSELLCQHERE
jgi:hypothetical protein